ncbi:phosphotyrosyl phosphatase activator [Naematelia encephala]|uniref:Serine/threonine-protein phosphatase 2A activator n=1 Tax=Naematelia encephala TaxID=71784 RepID=A0A1Y2AYM4_9TREE|nr:phosphotyrosyl phosphatase activator [Naematelia encephala]
MASTSYIPPTKRILSDAQLDFFKRSKTHDEILDFIDKLNQSIVGQKLTEAGEGSERTRPLIAILDAVLDIAKNTPPVDNKLSRFGNPAFKTFYDRVQEASPHLHEGLIPVEAIPEVQVYFQESWGNKQRVDYGSGMELNFVCWMLCLVKLGVLREEDYRFMVLGVFWKYIKVMRYLQSTYWLEPAGSHGVWGLDDYHFLPFFWGAGQLRGENSFLLCSCRDHKYLRPKSIHDPEILEAFSEDYMYLSSIAFINSIKSASLRWHSPMLDDISAVKTWAKINDGMRKMYAAEVLGKLPIIQHALFGSLLPPPNDLPSIEAVTDEHGHIHAKGTTGWAMDCCGIPVPSAFGEAIASRPGLKAIPFD